MRYTVACVPEVFAAQKNRKIHRSWSVVKSRGYADGKVAQRHVLYLGELNDSQRASRLADQLWRQPELDRFFAPRLSISREGTQWEKVQRILVIYRLLAPGSEWRLHRQWFETTALADLLGVDARSAQDDTLYRCHDLVLEHKEPPFAHLRTRWADLFGVRYEVLLYDLTSTYFASLRPARLPLLCSSCVVSQQGWVSSKRALVGQFYAGVDKPEGLPLAYEMMPGDTADKTTLRDMLALVQKHHGQAERVWVMDCGIPTEETLAEMRAGTPPVHYLVGTPKGRLTRMEVDLTERP